MSVTAVPLRPTKKGSVLKLWLGLALLALIAVGAAWIGTSGQVWTTTASGLKIRTIEEGEGAHPTAADVAFVTYTGRLADSGKVFDSNVGQQPVPFPVAEGATIPGFSEGLKLMKKGGSYRLRIPPALGYADKEMGDGQIPANSTLDFDVEILEVMPEAQLRQLMQQQQMMMQGGPGGPPLGGEGAPQDQ
ncbi:MAG TPA: FKBP-type peptidyl-prolyl cis-trans isomerase [Allosphingosinicella sp.]|nr:FKBP-type peptidyl-prolyl cis-trans isomerase [Allosphingosinicella sp.]